CPDSWISAFIKQKSIFQFKSSPSKKTLQVRCTKDFKERSLNFSTHLCPYLKNPIPDQSVIIDELFNYMIPDSTFIDDDGNNTLTFHALLTNGDILPSWLTFDTITGTFSGIPSVEGTLNIAVTATDTAGASANTHFKIITDINTSLRQHGMHGLCISPNPSRGLITLAFDNPLRQQAKLIICNAVGELIHSTECANNYVCDLTAFPKGIYIVYLHINGEAHHGKLVLN
ncbi:MAG: putative Ig domain-containing protein, partial [Bacteroidetes bacterium]|nr:putative Ig domain-containing protein [Bacteroidota bacterium]